MAISSLESEKKCEEMSDEINLFIDLQERKLGNDDSENYNTYYWTSEANIMFNKLNNDFWNEKEKILG